MKVVGEVPASVDWRAVTWRPQPEGRTVETAPHPTTPVHAGVLVALTAARRDALARVEGRHQVFLLLMLMVQPVVVVEDEHGVVLEEGMVGWRC